jgi:hypothetical protein
MRGWTLDLSSREVEQMITLRDVAVTQRLDLLRQRTNKQTGASPAVTDRPPREKLLFPSQREA